MLAAACGAGNAAGPAEAAPRHARKPAKHTAHASAARAALPPVIGAADAEHVKLAWETAVGGFGKGVAVDSAIRRVAASSGSPVLLYDLVTGKPAGSLRTCKDVIRGGVAFVGHKLLVVCESGLELFDPVKLAKLHAPRVNPSKVTAASVAWPRLALGHHDGVIRIYGLDGSPTIEIPVPGPPVDVKSLALDPAGKRVAVAWVQGSIWLWDTSSPASPQKLVRHESEADAIAFSDDGAWLAEEGEPAHTVVWSLAASPPSERAKLKNGEWIKRLIFTHDGKWLVRGGSDGLELAEIDGPRRVALDTTGKVEDVATDARGAVLAAIDRKGRLTVWRVR